VATTDTSEASSEPFSPYLEATAWAALAIYIALVIGFAWNPTPLAQALAAIGIISAGAHAALMYGWKHAAVLFAICVITTFSIENLGVATGVPFGHYHFEVGAALPHVGLIPIIVGPVWFGMGYFSWIVAGILLAGLDQRLKGKFAVVSLPIVAAFVMTQWDVVMEPPEATISKAWIWHDGGAHFGVPLSNYLGWLLTTWLFYQAFAIYLSLSRNLPRLPIRHIRKLGAVAIVLYLGSGLTHVTPWMMAQSGEIADAGGHIWRVQDLREATVVAMLFTMFFTSMLAAFRLANDDPRS
jgi:putative membrane protein